MPTAAGKRGSTRPTIVRSYQRPFRDCEAGGATHVVRWTCNHRCPREEQLKRGDDQSPNSVLTSQSDTVPSSALPVASIFPSGLKATDQVPLAFGT